MRAYIVRAVFLAVCAGASSVSFAQASAVSLNVVVCGPSGASGVTYVSGAGRPVTCGTDASGDTLELQVDDLVAVNPESGSGDQPVMGGEVVGAEIGGAVLGVLAIAFCFRLLRNFINSSSEG